MTTSVVPGAYIVGAVRTPVGKRGGGLAAVHPADLGAAALTALMNRTGLDPAAVEDVIFGCVDTVGPQAGDIARTAWLAAGLPEHVPGTTVDRQCGSSQQAVHFAAQAVLSGTADMVVAGGVQSMSTIPIAYAMTAAEPLGFPDPFSGSKGWRARYGDAPVSQFHAAETIAEKWSISREDMEEFAVASHSKALRAQAEGRFTREIEPVEGVTVTADEGPRQPNWDKISSLPPLLPQGRLTAATSSQLSDAAAALLIVSETGLRVHGLTPRARIHHVSAWGADPLLMLTAPIPATSFALARAGLTVDDIDLIEINEAFASVVLAWLAETGADPARVNVNGGAIALGHPLGATGARLMTTLLHELERTRGRYGLQTMCEGGGQANVTIIERLLSRTGLSDLPPFDFGDRVVLVTGGTRGIGRAIAESFLSAGAPVVVCARGEPSSLPPGAAFVRADLREPDQAAGVVARAVELHGRLDVVVNNAGGSPAADAATVSPRFVEKIVALNLLAPFYVAQPANAVMQAQDSGGVIVNIGSVAAHQAEPESAPYAAAKAGLLQLTRALALEWAPKVRVNHITAGLIMTERSAEFYGPDGGASVARVIPMGRMALPSDVAAACLYLASPLAAYLTGVDLPVHGGGEIPARYLAAHGGLVSADPVRIRGPRLLLRPFRPDEIDAEWHAMVTADPMTVGGPPPDEAAFRARLARSGHMRDGWLDLAVDVDGRHVGRIQTFVPPDRELPSGTFDIGIGLIPGARGRGYGTEALALLTSWLFEHAAAEVVEAGTDPANAPMRAVFQRSGWTEAGPLTEIGREWIMYQITRSDWQSRSRPPAYPDMS